jgi:CheY-like chemotaxis protein
MDTRLPVVVIEEEPFLRDTLVEILEDEGWAETFATASEDEGLELLADLGAPCVVLADLLIPSHEADQFLDAVNALPDRGGLSVILVTGLPPAALQHELHHPVDGVLHKPFELTALLQTLERCRAHAVALPVA